ncbi:phospholipid metabolism enzyme regulator [Trichoderma arundinaceum]|uniref:Phospholipid metabolism enzyme regulator n=1 Tax=Trichoderma arundinaceum TaxID=490622 RepID=A0A395NUH2_TRIAR|nr:phospholipid metabolism enzyme regulator [Trichoderma arundinaceum]
MNRPPAAETDGVQGATQPAGPDMANHQPTPGAPASGTTSSASATAGGQTSRQSSASNSVTHSPMGSRDPSPTRHPRRAASSSGRINGSRSRNNSQLDHSQSPSRQSKSTLGGPASGLRSLSATTTPTLVPVTANQDSQHIQAPAPQKPAQSSESRDSTKWPVSPRVRSPPLQLLRNGSPTPRPSEQDPPLINVQHPSPSAQQQADSYQYLTASESEAEDLQMASGLRTPARGPLETVQEVSQPNSPARRRQRESSLMEHVREKLSYADSNHSDIDGGRTLRARPMLSSHESGGDSAGARRTTSVPPPLLSRQSSAIMLSKQAKVRPEGSTQTMTVETETVSSIPQVALAVGPKPDGMNGTLRTKQSTETIKPPKKEKKRSSRKQPVNSGNGSSKADIFEAKIANAVDEANTSDSEETFVYDSNPPDVGDRVTRRFHSRTPSATSIVSQSDRPNLRSIYGIMEGHVPAPKKSMKFSNTYGNGANDGMLTGDEDGRGTGRSASGSGRGTVRQHHHIGRWGRQPGNGHASLFDNESPFQASRPKMANSRHSSGPPSPRNHPSMRGPLSSKRSVIHMSSSYDLDETTGADDERTPLLENGRRGRFRRGPHNLRQAEAQTYSRRSSYLNRFAACLVLTMMFLLVITGAIGFMFATSQPLSDIEIMSIHNVVTSEQVLMFDVTVKAHNPNIVVVTIDHANLEIFAKSEYGGADSDWWDNPDGPKDNLVHPLDDPVNDPTPPGGEDDTKPNILLGRITEFDSPLTFEGSLFHQGLSSSTGEMQLPYPGNGTAGGSKRWERIYQNEFDLIVKGVVKYSLPLSAHIRSATVSGRTTVKPNSANNPPAKPNITAVAFEA